MTRTEKTPQPLAQHNGGNSEFKHSLYSLRRVKIQQYIYELQNQGWLEPALIILLLIGGLK